MQSTGLELLATRPPPVTSTRTNKTKSGKVAPLPVSPRGKDKDTGIDSDDRNIDIITMFASSSITRGEDSIVGNTIPIIEAREVLSLDEGSGRDEKMREWFEKHEPDDDEDEVDHKRRWVCPGCKDVI